MSAREIRILGDPTLRVPAKEVIEFDHELRALAKDMFDTMYRGSGIGLAGPQIGVSQRIVVLDLGDADEDGLGPLTLLNPKVVGASKSTERVSEGCLSLPGMEEVVERSASVVVEAQILDGDTITIEANDLLCRALLHEIDHLDGVLFVDRLSPLKRKLFMRRWRKSQAEEEDT